MPRDDMLELPGNAKLMLLLMREGTGTEMPHTTPASENVTHDTARLLLLLLPTTDNTFETWPGSNADADDGGFGVFVARTTGSANLACVCSDVQRVENTNASAEAGAAAAASRTTKDESVLLRTAR